MAIEQRVLDNDFVLIHIVQSFHNSVAQAYKAHREHGVTIQWEVKPREFKDDSEGGTW